MKPIRLVPIVVFSAVIASSCDDKADQKSAETAKQLATLAQKAEAATARQQELERELQEREIAAERDAIERERLEIEQARLEMENLQDENATAEADRIRQREMELATREGKIEQLQYTLEERRGELQQQGAQLNERDRELAGREAIALRDDQTEEEPAPAGDYGMFYDSLSSYGSWFETPDYGYVWQPVIVRDVSWRPYTRGRWACSDHGWTWISDEPFGWATYHYGRWALCKGRGWIWVPGSQWAPSWVSWRSSGSHIGWAPLPPETLAYADNCWDSSVDATFGIGSSWFCFVETRHFGNSIHHHCLPFDRNPIFVQQTVNITHIHVRNRRIICGGPTYGDVSKQVERQLPYYRLEMQRHGTYGDSQSMRPQVKGGKLRVKAPNLKVAWNQGIKPKQVRGSIEDVRIVRSEALRPEITERFQKNRQEESQRAEQTIADLGGEEKFRLHRARELANNRETAARSNQAARPSADKPSAARSPEKQPSEVRPEVQQAQAANPPQKTTRPERSVRPADRTPDVASNPKRPIASANRIHQSRPSNPSEDEPTVRSPRAQATDATPPNNAPPSRVNRFNNEPTADKEPQRTVNRPANRNAPEPEPERITPGRNTAQPVVDEAPRMRREQDEQVERSRQQQAENQQAQARQQQIEAQREQARQQQQEAAERQQQQARQQQQEAQREQARQQQMEESRREQARQQQMEESRREQARQQQMEESRREQARQQQMEESRREQARQQQAEESRREQARQQQQESDRQQERARQQRDEEERGRGRNR
jgi:hypothetical protein